MDIKNISPKALAFVYSNIESYLTNVFLIEKQYRFYVVDTFCGPDSMRPVLDIINKSSSNKEVIVINTHSHWDHVWGNCSFKNRNIICHAECRKLLSENWESELKRNEKYVLGKVEKHLPNVTFKSSINFEDDGIEIFHSPGHTMDSISIFDHEERIIYAGDNLEKPIIYVQSPDIETYIKTIEGYLNYRPKKIVSGHTLDLTEEDVLDTIKYLKGLSSGKHMDFETEYEKEIHSKNLNMVGKL